jgi:hypothetical protein
MIQLKSRETLVLYIIICYYTIRLIPQSDGSRPETLPTPEGKVTALKDVYVHIDRRSFFFFWGGKGSRGWRRFALMELCNFPFLASAADDDVALPRWDLHTVHFYRSSLLHVYPALFAPSAFRVVSPPFSCCCCRTRLRNRAKHSKLWTFSFKQKSNRSWIHWPRRFVKPIKYLRISYTCVIIVKSSWIKSRRRAAALIMWDAVLTACVI